MGFNLNRGQKGLCVPCLVGAVAALGPRLREISVILSRPFTGPFLDPLMQATQLLARTANEAGPFRSEIMATLTQSVLAMVAETQSGHALGQGGTRSDRLQNLDMLISQHMADGGLRRILRRHCR